MVSTVLGPGCKVMNKANIVLISRNFKPKMSGFNLSLLGLSFCGHTATDREKALSTLWLGQRGRWNWTFRLITPLSWFEINRRCLGNCLSDLEEHSPCFFQEWQFFTCWWWIWVSETLDIIRLFIPCKPKGNWWFPVAHPFLGIPCCSLMSQKASAWSLFREFTI